MLYKVVKLTHFKDPENEREGHEQIRHTQEEYGFVFDTKKQADTFVKNNPPHISERGNGFFVKHSYKVVPTENPDYYALLHHDEGEEGS